MNFKTKKQAEKQKQLQQGKRETENEKMKELSLGFTSMRGLKRSTQMQDKTSSLTQSYSDVHASAKNSRQFLSAR